MDAARCPACIEGSYACSERKAGLNADYTKPLCGNLKQPYSNIKGPGTQPYTVLPSACNKAALIASFVTQREQQQHA